MDLLLIIQLAAARIPGRVYVPDPIAILTQALDQGGPVEVGVRETPAGWELSVADSGRTLASELREKAFVPFMPQRARGSGLLE